MQVKKITGEIVNMEMTKREARFIRDCILITRLDFNPNLFGDFSHDVEVDDMVNTLAQFYDNIISKKPEEKENE